MQKLILILALILGVVICAPYPPIHSPARFSAALESVEHSKARIWESFSYLWFDYTTQRQRLDQFDRSGQVAKSIFTLCDDMYLNAYEYTLDKNGSCSSQKVSCQMDVQIWQNFTYVSSPLVRGVQTNAYAGIVDDFNTTMVTVFLTDSAFYGDTVIRRSITKSAGQAPVQLDFLNVVYDVDPQKLQLPAACQQ
eukprot:TRINITY_DN3348_c0_g3_i1.p1 TRINITY_DN3348_c0_g3~~TRINITY_DN3348_c0_g3_i1.p1  ORF type:complete len:218 (-),score=72.30 TRINITY_DN3348_c0_g3_i1:183-764(-)